MYVILPTRSILLKTCVLKICPILKLIEFIKNNIQCFCLDSYTELSCVFHLELIFVGYFALTMTFENIIY